MIKTRTDCVKSVNGENFKFEFCRLHVHVKEVVVRLKCRPTRNVSSDGGSKGRREEVVV